MNDKADKDGVEPKALRDKPKIDSPHVYEICTAFWMIHAGRSMDGFGGFIPISLAHIRDYIELFGTPAMDLDLFVRHIYRQDSLYRSLKAKKDK